MPFWNNNKANHNALTILICEDNEKIVTALHKAVSEKFAKQVKGMEIVIHEVEDLVDLIKWFSLPSIHMVIVDIISNKTYFGSFQTLNRIISLVRAKHQGVVIGINTGYHPEDVKDTILNDNYIMDKVVFDKNIIFISDKREHLFTGLDKAVEMVLSNMNK